jgi:hypothetical protein
MWATHRPPREPRRNTVEELKEAAVSASSKAKLRERAKSRKGRDAEENAVVVLNTSRALVRT